MQIRLSSGVLLCNFVHFLKSAERLQLNFALEWIE